MPVCIQCRYPLTQLYQVLHTRQTRLQASQDDTGASLTQRAVLGAPGIASLSSTALHQNTDRASLATSPPPSISPSIRSGKTQYDKLAVGGGDVRLVQCPRCQKFADKYVEHDYVVLFIDLVLVKPQVYRHLLFNRFSHDAQRLDPAIRRLGALLIFFDVYMNMLQIEAGSHLGSTASSISRPNVVLQWVFLVIVCVVSTIAQHLVVRALARLLQLSRKSQYFRRDADFSDHESSSSNAGNAGRTRDLDQASDSSDGFSVAGLPTASAVSTALLISSCMSIFPLVMIVWKPDAMTMHRADSDSQIDLLASLFAMSGAGGIAWIRKGVSWAVALQNLEALRILLVCGYTQAAFLVAGGAIAKWFMSTLTLRLFNVHALE